MTDLAERGSLGVRELQPPFQLGPQDAIFGGQILKFDNSVLKELDRISKDVVTEAGSGDELSRKIYASYQQFLPSIIDWSDIAEGAVLSRRRLA